MKLNRITASLLPTLLALSAVPMLAKAQSYEVVELPTSDLSTNQYASSIDETGLILNIVEERFNQPIDLSLINLDSLTLSDADAAAQGNFNGTDLSTITAALYTSTQSNSVFNQKLAQYVAVKTDGVSTEYINGFDTETDATNGFTYSLDTELGDSYNGTYIVGSMTGAFTQIPYINESGDELIYVVNDVKNRAFVQVDDYVAPLLPVDATLGGISEASAINSNLQVAGYSSVAVSDSVTSAIANCDDPDTRGDIPLEVCYYTIINEFESSLTRHATVWQLDTAGNTISTQSYGLTFEPDNDVDIIFSSVATDINNEGQAVGSTPVPIESTYMQAAAIFQNGQTQRLLADDDLLPNAAVAINDDGLVAGYNTVVINSATRFKFFVYNINTDELIFPDDFFTSSTSIPRAINNNGLVVGDAESDADTRRRNAFLYDVNANTFTNINTLIACDSDYEIMTANDINDNNEIVGEALVQKPFRNAKGEIVTDSNGEEVLVDTVIAVKLSPTGGSPVECELSDVEIADSTRQGASLGFFGLVGLLAFGIARRLKYR